MSDSRFDNLARFLGGRPSRRQVLKGLLGGGALTAAAITLPFGEAAAQCVEDGKACSAGSDCCSGNCDATTGFCGVEGETTCLPDGQACSAAADCCSGNCDATTGYCGVPVEAAGGTTGTTSLPASGSGMSQGSDMSLIVPVAAVGAAAAVLGARRMRATAQDETSA